MKMSKPRVFITRNDVDDQALALLRERCQVEVWESTEPIPAETLHQRIAGVHGVYLLLTEKVHKEFLEAAGPQLKVIGTMSVGFDHMDAAAIQAAGVKVGNTPGVLTDATAELTVALTLATARRFFEAHKEITNDGWKKAAWAPSWMTGVQISGSVIGVVGLGRIGLAVAQRLKAFNPSRILYSGNTPKPEASSIGAEFVELDALLSSSDIVIVACALNDHTRNLFTQDKFSKMKKSAIFINVSRGAVVDQDALVRALKENQIWAAGLDVMTPEPLPCDSPLLNIPNLTLIPHIGSATMETRRNMAMMTARNILGGLFDEPMPAQLF